MNVYFVNVKYATAQMDQLTNNRTSKLNDITMDAFNRTKYRRKLD